MNNGIELEVTWFDDDAVGLRTRASNGRFAGEVDLYATHTDLGHAADVLRGFPSSATDRREIELGTFDPRFAGGGLRLVFLCIDGWGHSAVEVRLRTDNQSVSGKSETAEFLASVEPAAIDRFVSALEKMQISVGAAARLQIEVR